MAAQKEIGKLEKFLLDHSSYIAGYTMYRPNMTEQDISNILLENTGLQWANLKRANLSNSVFRHVEFRYADLQEANLENCIFEECCLRYTNFIKANLTGTKFIKCSNFDKAIFHNLDCIL